MGAYADVQRLVQTLFFWGGSESGAKTHVPAPIHINSLEIDTEKTMKDCEQIKNVENE